MSEGHHHHHHPHGEGGQYPGYPGGGSGGYPGGGSGGYPGGGSGGYPGGGGGGYPGGGSGGYPGGGSGGYPGGGSGGYPAGGRSGSDVSQFYIVSFKNNMVVDVEGGNKNQGTKIVMYKKNATPSPNQLWYRDQNGYIRSVLNDMAFTAKGKGEDLTMQPISGPGSQWTYQEPRIQNAAGLALDIRGDHGSQGSTLCAYDYNNKDNQHWRLEYVNT